MLIRRHLMLWTLPAATLGLLLACGDAAHPPGAATGSTPSAAPSATGTVPTLPTGGGTAPGAGTMPVTCTGGPIAQTPFTGALCTCNDANIQGYLRTRAFNSPQGPYDPNGNLGGAAVGVNHDYVIAASGANAGFTDIGGSFQVAGSATGFDGFIAVAGDLASAGTLDVKGYTQVARDAWLGGDFLNTGFAQVGRDLHIQGKDMLPAWVGRNRDPGPVSVSPPCACAPSQILNIASLVAAAATSNDDAGIHLATNAFAGVIGDVEVTLPAGKYYLDSIAGIGNLAIHVAGPVSLFVGGDVRPTGRFAIDLAPAGEIDLFIAGDLQFTGYAPLGDPARPYATRIYSSTQGPIDLTGFESFVGNLYAPGASVTSRGFVNVYGSFFVRDFTSAGYASFVYDLAVAGGGGSTCTPPGPTGEPCTVFSCASGQACVNGACGPCKADSDCPGQLVCAGGRCGALIQ